MKNLMAGRPYCISPLASEIRAEGRVQGRAQGRAEDILLVLSGRGIRTTNAVSRRITACLDAELLRQWLIRAIHATTAEEIFGEEPSADRPSWTHP
ncbi:hypothetical protein [Streptomyces atroolivaceus]|uniref:hypothetical protein n=1 Tax=Streptomyces atroolivaceus TaxID=66869 RepID=UPI00362B7BA6